jgi:hypothetical protein
MCDPADRPTIAALRRLLQPANGTGIDGPPQWRPLSFQTELPMSSIGTFETSRNVHIPDLQWLTSAANHGAIFLARPVAL